MKKSRFTKTAVVLSAVFFLFALIPIWAHAQGRAVVAATLKAAPEKYSGSCPTVIKFNGEITARNLKPGTMVEYQFISSDGTAGPIQKIAFATGVGVVKVATTLNVGGKTLRNYKGWKAIKITNPVSNIVSNKALFEVSCKSLVPGTAPDFDRKKIMDFDPQPEPPGVSQRPQQGAK